MYAIGTATKTRGAAAPFEPPFPTPLFKLKLLLLVATCDQSNAQVTVCESLCCVDHTEFYHHSFISQLVVILA